MLAPMIQHNQVIPHLSSKISTLWPNATLAAASNLSDGPLILVAEDDAIMRRLLTLILERDHFRVVAVTNGAEAVAVFAHYDFDLVLMDIMMPIMDGFNACASIRRASSVPIVLISAFSSIDVKAKAKRSGASHFLNKPCHPKELKKQLHAWLPKAVQHCEES